MSRAKPRCVEGRGGDLAEAAYRLLQERLWSGALVPGAKVSESRLAKELGMSRTPVREAIARLEREGVMQQVASSGTFVREPDRLAIVEAYEVRIAIECFAVQKAALRMKPAEVRALRDHCDGMLAAIREFRDSGDAAMGGEPLGRYLSADLDFHFMLVESAANRRALDIFQDVNLLNFIFGCRSHERDLHHVAWVWLAHARVADAIRRRDPGAALRALERHMRSSMGAALQAYDERLAGRGRSGDKAPGDHGAMTTIAASTHRRDSSKIRDVAERPRRLARATRAAGQTLARSATSSPPVVPPSGGMISDPHFNPLGNRSNP